eukprot:2165038-Rhodomonas_salina.1
MEQVGPLTLPLLMMEWIPEEYHLDLIDFFLDKPHALFIGQHNSLPSDTTACPPNPLQQPPLL